MVGICPDREILGNPHPPIPGMKSMWLGPKSMDRPECDIILNCHPGRLVRAEVDLSLTVSYLELSLAINHGLLIEDIDEFPYPEIASDVCRDVTIHNLNYFTRTLVCVFGQSPPGYEEILFLKGKVGIGERCMVIGHCLAHRLATCSPLHPGDPVRCMEGCPGKWLWKLCVFSSRVCPLPELMEEMVMESELMAFDKAGFRIHQALTEEEARLRRQTSLTRVDVGWALLKTKYLLWLQFWTPRLQRSHKNKRMRDQERCRKVAEAEAEAAGSSVPSPRPKPPKQLFETDAASMAAIGQT